MTITPMGAEEFKKIGQALFGTRHRGRGAWQGRFATRLGMTSGRLRQIIRADEVPGQVAIHARDVLRIFQLTGSRDGPKAPPKE
jgi:hypothetical protein